MGQDSREQAIQFLEDLESRHNQLLDQLSDLNSQIEHALEQCTQRREPIATATDTYPDSGPSS